MGGTGVHNPADLTAVNVSLAAIAVTQAVILAVVQDTNADLEVVDGNVDAIRAMTDATAILTETGGTITTDGTEQNVYINNAPAGVYEPRWFNINFTNHTVTESVTIRTYYRNVAGGGWVQDDNEPIVGVPVNLLLSIKLKPNRYGTRVTIEKTAGTNRAYVWEVLYEV